MARKIDIGGYFDKLTQQARGGRRIDGRTATGRSSSPALDDAVDSSSSSRSGGLKDMLRDMLGTGRHAAERTTARIGERVAQRRKPRIELPPEGVVHVEYSPQEDGDPDPGEVVWTWVPFEEDPDQGKDRPVVIIGRRGRSLVGVPLTTKANDHEAQVDLGTGAWDPKRRTSYARVWRMLDVDPDRTRREGAALDVERFEQLIAAVDHYYDVKLPATTSDRRSSSADDVDF